MGAPKRKALEMVVTLLTRFKYAKELEFEGTRFHVVNNPHTSAPANTIGWMSDQWDKYPEWRDRGLLRDVFQAGEMNHTDVVWLGPVPE